VKQITGVGRLKGSPTPVTKEKKFFEILIVVFPTQRMSTIQSGSGIQHPLPMHRKTTIKQLRLGRDGYPNTIKNISQERKEAWC